MEHVASVLERSAPQASPPLRRVLLSLLVVGLLGPLAIGSARGAFGTATASGGEAFTAGTVYLTTAAPTTAPLSMPNAEPGATSWTDTSISYAGTLPAEVRLYASISDAGLAPYLDVRIDRGTGTGAAFAPDRIVYSGTLDDLPRGWTTGLVEPDTWAQGDVAVYRISVTLTDDPAAQGLSASASFVWEARNR